MSQFSRRHFNDIDIQELIHKYKQYECLWNFNSIDYKNKALKQESWQEIADYFNKDVNEVKRKIKYMRSAYVGEKRKVKASKLSGSETPHKPILFYYNDFAFLDKIVVLRKYGHDPDHDNENTNISQDTEDYEIENFENEDINFEEGDINFKVEPLVEPEIEQRISPHMPTVNSPRIMNSRSLPSRPVKRKISGAVNKSPLKTTQSLDSNHSDPYKNIYISFGKTIALQLQQLPLEMAILAMSEIHTILTKKTVEHIRSLQKRDVSRSYSESDYSFNELIEEDFNDSS